MLYNSLENKILNWIDSADEPTSPGTQKVDPVDWLL